MTARRCRCPSIGLFAVGVASVSFFVRDVVHDYHVTIVDGDVADDTNGCKSKVLHNRVSSIYYVSAFECIVNSSISVSNKSCKGRMAHL